MDLCGFTSERKEEGGNKIEHTHKKKKTRAWPLRSHLSTWINSPYPPFFFKLATREVKNPFLSLLTQTFFFPVFFLCVCVVGKRKKKRWIWDFETCLSVCVFASYVLSLIQQRPLREWRPPSGCAARWTPSLFICRHQGRPFFCIWYTRTNAQFLFLFIYTHTSCVCVCINVQTLSSLFRNATRTASHVIYTFQRFR